MLVKRADTAFWLYTVVLFTYIRDKVMAKLMTQSIKNVGLGFSQRRDSGPAVPIKKSKGRICLLYN